MGQPRGWQGGKSRPRDTVSCESEGLRDSAQKKLFSLSQPSVSLCNTEGEGSLAVNWWRGDKTAPEFQFKFPVALRW